MIRRILLVAGLFLAAIVLMVGVWIGSWAVPPQPPADGANQIQALHGIVTIVRDERGIPHIHALDVPDAFFAQGYVTAQDRLFQMDLLRRLIGGELSEVFGKAALQADEEARVISPRSLARGQYARLSRSGRALVDAYARGVNAGMRSRPLPPEFHALLYRPRPWTGEDSALAGLATVLDLTNKWGEILLRQRVNEKIGAAAAEGLNPLSDPRYDVPLIGKVTGPPCRPPELGRGPPAGAVDFTSTAADMNSAAPWFVSGDVDASNEWAIGAARTTTHRAIVANDPHLDFHVPGTWYLIEMQAPGFHVSGAALAGVPGVILGHTDGLAWGATNATVSTVTVYRDRLEAIRRTGDEVIPVRFGSAAVTTHEATDHGFVFAKDGGIAYSAQWVASRVAGSPLETFFVLDRAQTIEQGLGALREFVGPPQNFVLGDSTGRVAYHMAGLIPIDGIWSTGVIDGDRVRDAWRGFVPFDLLPHVDPSRDAIVFTANNRVVGSQYPFRMTDQWTPAYRAHRIADLLTPTHRAFSIDDVREMQLDTLSLADLEFARDLAQALGAKPAPSARERAVAKTLAAWDGRMNSDSVAGSLAWESRRLAARRYASSVLGPDLGGQWSAGDSGDRRATEAMLCALRSHAVTIAQLEPEVPQTDPKPWRELSATPLYHPLHKLGIALFDAPPLPGYGDYASIAARTKVHGQSFRAVWDVGRWRTGGIIIPLGESGLMRTAHATDQEADYIAGRLHPL